MTSGPRAEPRCDFCGEPEGVTGTLFAGKLGGMPPHICGLCVLELAGRVVALVAAAHGGEAGQA